MPFSPSGDSLLSRIEPAAIGSLLVLVALIGAIGFGGWSVLKEVQRVQVAPVDQTPVVLSDLDPLDGALSAAPADAGSSNPPASFEAPRADALDRLYRPQALDVPVLVARDAPIATIDPRTVGNFAAPDADAPVGENAQFAATDAAVTEALGGTAVPQVFEGTPDTVRMVAIEPSWVQVTSVDGTVIFEATMNKGDTWEIPATEEPPMLITGQSGAIYFAMDNAYYGPVGPRGAVTKDVPLARQALAELYDPAVINDNSLLATYVAELQNTVVAPAQDSAD
jgi:hypothetical protein